MNKSLLSAIIAGIVAPALIGFSYEAWQNRPPATPAFDWGIRGNGVLNAIERLEEFDGERGRFSYHTGGRARDQGPLTAPPTHVFAEASHGPVAVRFLGFDGYERARASAEALELARIVSAATTGFFPAAAIPVEIDVHFMPEDARFSFAKRVDWHEGRPFVLALFSRDRLDRGTAAHELHHVLAHRWPLPGTLAHEEAAAELYAACGQLLANETLPRGDPSKDRVTLGDRTFDGALAGDELAAVLEVVRSGPRPEVSRAFGPLLAATAFEHIFGGATAIALDSPQAETLLALCKETAPNPLALEAWLENVVPAADSVDSATD
jgi:hypothetical protein